MSYTLHGYGRMIGDPVRMDAYVKAMEKSVRSGDVVIDLGTGIGFFSVLACKLGASRVYALEPDESIEVARRVAQDNGCAEKIEFINALSTAATPALKADVIVSDLRGVLPLHEAHIPSLIDARSRLLKTSGILIPECDDIWCTVLDNPDQYRIITEPWAHGPHDVDLKAVHALLSNNWTKSRITPESMITNPVKVLSIDYRTVDSPNAVANVTLTSTRRATAHGIGMWFDTRLFDDIGFSNSPSSAEAIYGNAIFPFEEPAEVEDGDLIELFIQARLVDTHYVWRWAAKFLTPGGRVKHEREQSTLKSSAPSLGDLHRFRDDFVPQRGNRTDEVRLVATMIDGSASLRSIAAELAATYPAIYPDWKAALGVVSEIAGFLGREI